MHLSAKIFLFSLFAFCISLKCSSQSDTVKTERKKNKETYRYARIATVMSAVLPGAGQVYNKKYWKLPIVYAGLGGFGYLFYVNQREFKYYSDNLKAEYDEDPNTINNSGYSGDNLVRLKTQYRKFRDLGVIGCTIVYVLNIVDANVDAHLRTFDMSDDLSLQIKPYSNLYVINNTCGLQTGITINLKFH